MHSRIFINDNIMGHKWQRGVSRYFRQVTDGIVEAFGSDVVVFSPEKRDYGSATHICLRSLSGRYRRKAREAVSTLVGRVVRPAVMFSPYYGNTGTRAAQVFTVYDMIYELLPHYYPQTNRFNRRFVAEKKCCLERADALLAISLSAAHDIVRCYPHINPNKIHITPLGVDASFFERYSYEATKAKPYFLYVGHRTMYKNFTRLLLAYAMSGLAAHVDLRVISPTSADFDADERKIIDKYRLSQNIHLFTSVSEVELRRAYAHAVAFVYPSEYEGFGLPILEAMASGTLVATSNVSSMPEVGGDAALYFDPLSVESISACLQRVVGLSSQDRVQHIEQGVDQAKRFSWSNCQQTSVQVIKRFL